MDAKPCTDLCSALWDQLQAADKEWTEAVQDAADLQTSFLRDAANARKEKAGKDKDLKYELWRLSDLLDELSHPE